MNFKGMKVRDIVEHYTKDATLYYGLSLCENRCGYVLNCYKRSGVYISSLFICDFDIVKGDYKVISDMVEFINKQETLYKSPLMKALR